MSEFAPMPTALVAELQPLPEDLGVRGNQARVNLARKGLFVFAGMTREIVASTGIIAQQPHVAEYCPNDVNRHGTIERTQLWLPKHGGRAALPLMKYDGVEPFNFADLVDEELTDLSQVIDPAKCRQVGMGWTGHEPSEQKKTGMYSTFAERIAIELKGQRASVDYAVAIVAGSTALYGTDEIGCQTYKSNRASHGYELAGFSFVPGTEEEVMRPTLVRPGPEKVPDARLYMAYNHDLLDVPMPPDLIAA
jgi:hypothetical protein